MQEHMQTAINAMLLVFDELEDETMLRRLGDAVKEVKIMQREIHKGQA